MSLRIVREDYVDPSFQEELAARERMIKNLIERGYVVSAHNVALHKAAYRRHVRRVGIGYPLWMLVWLSASTMFIACGIAFGAFFLNGDIQTGVIFTVGALAALAVIFFLRALIEGLGIDVTADWKVRKLGDVSLPNEMVARVLYIRTTYPNVALSVETLRDNTLLFLNVEEGDNDPLCVGAW